MTDQDETSDLDIARVCRVDMIAVCLQCHACRVEGPGRPAEIARGECHFGRRDDASCARDRLPRAEGATRAAKERLRSREIPELRHRDAAQGETRAILTQRNTIQGAERISGGQGARRGGNERIHSE